MNQEPSNARLLFDTLDSFDAVSNLLGSPESETCEFKDGGFVGHEKEWKCLKSGSDLPAVGRELARTEGQTPNYHRCVGIKIAGGDRKHAL